MKVLAVAEKNSISKTVSRFLSHDNFTTSNTRDKYIKNYKFPYYWQGRPCNVTMTSVKGHCMDLEFNSDYKKWNDCDPEQLYTCPIVKTVKEDCKDLQHNLETNARDADVLFIWTDCDREGENIGSEVVSICQKIIQGYLLNVLGSPLSRLQLRHAWDNPIDLDYRSARAVDARTELDLRIGASFTRLQTLYLQVCFPALFDKKVVSFGGCQFPTLGFVVERFLQIESFIPESFWYLDVTYTDPQDANNTARFNWCRFRLYDQMVCAVIYEKCVDNPMAKVVAVESRRKERWAPLPLTTVELQKIASTKLRMSADGIMSIAEKLYQEGFISYPRTETDIFEPEFELHPLIQSQTQDRTWGAYATSLLQDGKFRRPRNGQQNDKAHPPIHPLRDTGNLEGDRYKVFEFITRRFLACCSRNAVGSETKVDIEIDAEQFTCKGLVILERNFFDIYKYDTWNVNSIPNFTLGQIYQPSSLEMKDGITTAPKLLTEAELINLMDKSGIGTDATIHEHIKKIKDREYVTVENSSFTPTILGIALTEAYDEMEIDLSLSKPDLRRQMEANMKDVVANRMTKEQMLTRNIAMYREAFFVANGQKGLFRTHFERLLNNNNPAAPQSNRRPPPPNNPRPPPPPNNNNRRPPRNNDDEDYDGGDDYNAGAQLRNDGNNQQQPGFNNHQALNFSQQIHNHNNPAQSNFSLQPDNHFQQPNPRPNPIDMFRANFEGTSGPVNTNFTNTNHNSEGVLSPPNCNCQAPSRLLTVRKEGPNTGKTFYGCGGNARCGFFQWTDDMGGGNTRNSNDNGSSIRSFQQNFNSDPQLSPPKITCQCDLVAVLKQSTKVKERGRIFTVV